jgi:hypothetical protein
LTEITLGSTQGVLIKSLIPVYQFGPLGTYPCPELRENVRLQMRGGIA